VQKSSSFGSETQTQATQAGPWRGVAHGRARTLVKRKPVLTPGGRGIWGEGLRSRPTTGDPEKGVPDAACCLLGGVRIVRCTALRVHASFHKR